jgi:hypothetical protein
MVGDKIKKNENSWYFILEFEVTLTNFIEISGANGASERIILWRISYINKIIGPNINSNSAAWG